MILYVPELYSYTEGPEFALNRKCFEVELRAHGKSVSADIVVWSSANMSEPLVPLVLVPDEKWTELDAEQHRAHAMRLLDTLEVTARDKRLKVARAILYMAQGEFGEK